MQRQEIMREIQQCNNEVQEKILCMAEAICRYRHDDEREERILEALRDCMEP